MSTQLLKRYLLKTAAVTTDPRLQNEMINLLQQLSSPQQPQQQQSVGDAAVEDGEDESVVAPELNKGIQQNNAPKQMEDMLLQKAMPELQMPNPENPESFGKVNVQPPPIHKVSMFTCLKRSARMRVKMSAYIKDIKISELPAKVQEEIKRFIPANTKNPYIVHYGMVVPELVERADKQNMETAIAHVKKEYDKLTKDGLANAKDELIKRLPNKYILMVNDQIVDGHHFLAKAKYLGITNSLNVLDLTPARFQ